MFEKFKSRKFLITVITMILGIATALTNIGGTVGTVCGIIATVLSPIVYIIVEGNIDAKAAKLLSDAVNDAVKQATELKKK